MRMIGKRVEDFMTVVLVPLTKRMINDNMSVILFKQGGTHHVFSVQSKRLF